MYSVFQLTKNRKRGNYHGVHELKMGAEKVNLYVQSEHITSGNCCEKYLSYSLVAILIGLVYLTMMENHGLSEGERIDELVEKTHKEHFKNTSLLKVNIPRTSEYLECNIVGKDAILQEKPDKPSHDNKEHFKNTSLLKVNIPRTSEYLECNIVGKDAILQEKPDKPSHDNKEHFKNTSLLKVNIPRTSEYVQCNIVGKDAILQEKADEPSHDNNVSAPVIKPHSETHNCCALDERDFIEAELKRAKEHFNQYNLKVSLEIYDNLAVKYPDSPAALYGKINALHYIASITGSTNILESLIEICLQYLALDDLVSDKDFKTTSYYCIQQTIMLNKIDITIDIYLQLMKRFDDDPNIRTELAEIYMNVERYSDAKDILKENLKRWPNNGTCLTYYGYVIQFENNLEQSVLYLQLGLKTDEYKTRTKTFYSALGTILLLLNRTEESRKVFRRAVAMKLYPSVYQRPGIYIKNIKTQPIWTKAETPYIDVFDLLESNWRRIRDEGLSILKKTGYFITQKVDLRQTGIWQVFDIVTHGEKHLKNCESAQFTYGLFQSFIRHICYTCDLFFSVIHPGTHIQPHCGPHNARIRAHLGLQVPNDTKIRIVEDERSWEEGKFLIFDDSFEHEIWHNGKEGVRLILIVNFWHPQVTEDHKAFIKQEEFDNIFA